MSVKSNPSTSRHRLGSNSSDTWAGNVSLTGTTVGGRSAPGWPLPTPLVRPPPARQCHHPHPTAATPTHARHPHGTGPVTLTPVRAYPDHVDYTCYSIPMRTRFRGLDRREGVLIRGDAGWGEFSPFTEYGPQTSLPWLRAAREAAEQGFPAPRRRRIPVNV